MIEIQPRLMGQGIFVGICGMIRGHEHPGIKVIPIPLTLSASAVFYVFRLQNDMGSYLSIFKNFICNGAHPISLI